MSIVSLGQWLPDQPELRHPGLVTAKNVIPTAKGYRAMSRFASAGMTPLDGRARGMISALDLTGQSSNFAGDDTKLYRFSSTGRDDVSPTGGSTPIGTLPTTARWEFAQHFDRVIAVAPGLPPYGYQIGVDTDFVDLTGAPVAEHVAVVKQWTLLGNLTTDTSAVRWSAFNNPTSWPTPGTDAARLAQSDQQPLSGTGGIIQRIVALGDLGLIFQERAIWRMDFIGGDLVFGLNPMDTLRGALMPGGVCAAGRVAYFWAEEGIFATNGGETVPIGAEKIDRFVRDDLDTTYLDRVSSISDPSEPIVMWSYPGAGNTGGTPNRLLVYHTNLKQFALGEIDTEIVGLVAPIGQSFDAQNIPDLDSPSISMDVIQGTTAGPNRAGGYDTGHSLGDFSGMALAARMETGDREIAQELFGVPGRVSLVRGVRALVDGGTFEVSVATRESPQDTATFTSPVRPSATGTSDIRAKGRYHRARLDILEGGFTEAQALDVDVQVKGKR